MLVEQLGHGLLVVLDLFNGDPGETHHPERAWRAPATVSPATRHLWE
jgi:hypothetical protein